MSLQSLNNQIKEVESKMYALEKKGKILSPSWKILSLQRDLLFQTLHGTEIKAMLEDGLFNTDQAKDLANKVLDQIRKNYKQIKHKIDVA